MWRWVRHGRTTGTYGRLRPDRFSIDTGLRRRLAFRRGNMAALRRELVAAEAEGGPRAPSMATLARAVARDLLPGDLAGLRKGERARRAYGVFLQRPATYRNAAWEADHVEAPVEVDVAGRLLKPWITWFVDTHTNVICGTAVTAGPPNRASILAALRAAICVGVPYGPFGGLPELVRIDRGKDFLSNTVMAALGAFAVRVDDLPGYQPHLKGTVETVNGAAQVMFCAGLPCYTHAQTGANANPVDPRAPALPYETFVELLLEWVRWWNEEHTIGDRTPLATWEADPTPLVLVSTGDLWLFTLEDDGCVRKILTKGISWRGRFYVGPWMTGQAGLKVRLRYMPHHDHEIEVFDARTAVHLGRATLADRATPQEVAELMASRNRRRRQLMADLRAAERQRRQRYAASTTAGPAAPLGAVTRADMEQELAGDRDVALLKLARPPSLLMPRGEVPAGWVLPVDPDRQTAR
jgi:putative transposase